MVPLKPLSHEQPLGTFLPAELDGQAIDSHEPAAKQEHSGDATLGETPLKKRDVKMHDKKRKILTRVGIERELKSRFYWTEEEHQTFMDTLEKHGKNYRVVEYPIPGKTRAQIDSHGAYILM